MFLYLFYIQTFSINLFFFYAVMLSNFLFWFVLYYLYIINLISLIDQYFSHQRSIASLNFLSEFLINLMKLKTRKIRFNYFPSIDLPYNKGIECNQVEAQKSKKIKTLIPTLNIPSQVGRFRVLQAILICS